MPDSVGRTAMIAVIAGVLFAGFLALTPRLTAGTQEAAGPAVVATTVPAVSQSVVADPVVAIPTSAFDGWDRDVEAPEATVEVEEDWTDDEEDWTDERAEDDGSLTLAVELRGPRDGKETVIISEGDIVEWFVRVSNTSGEKLWGTFVYLEGAGHVICPSTRLEVDAHMDCTVHDNVWGGEQTADIWATAWTTDRQVATSVAYDYFIAD
jgi:hypothetical protein